MLSCIFNTMDKTIKQQAKKGDLILNRCIKNLCLTLDNKKIGNVLCDFLRSNSFISNFNIPFTIKEGQTNGKQYRGDMVEAYVYFLYENFGYESARRYIIKNIKNILGNESGFKKHNDLFWNKYRTMLRKSGYFKKKK